MSNQTNENARVSTSWSGARVMVLAIACLGLGLPIGYVVRGSSSPLKPSALRSTPAPDPQPQAAAPAMPTEAQMKHMAEKKAEPLMEQLKKNPNDPALLAQVAKTYLYARQFQQAADYYERSAKIKADADVLTTLGGVYHFEGENAKAIDAWQRALKVDPKHADAWVNIGLVKWREQQDPKGAVEAWKQMLKTNPKHPQRASVEKMIAQAEKHAGITPPQNN